MPNVDGKEYPYTPKGMAAAAKAKRMKPSKEDASGRMAQRGLSKAAGTKGRQMPRKPLTPKQKEALDNMVPLKPRNPRKPKKDELTIPKFMKDFGKPKQKLGKAVRGVVPKPRKPRKQF